MSIQTFRNIDTTSFILTTLLLFTSFAGFSQDYKTAKAQNGDGIYSLLKRHGVPASEFKNFIEINQEKLGKNNQLIVGRSYKLPGTGSQPEAVSQETSNTGNGNKVEIHKIFGPKYERVNIADNQLKGAVYYLKSGHGGPDPGAIGKYGSHTLCEDEYAYDVTLRLARKLIEHGATVYMIVRDPNDGIRDESFLKPDKDEVCYPNQKIPLKQLSRLHQRKDAVNNLYAKHKGSFQRFVVIHVDSRSKGENIDVFFYYDERSKTGKKLAENLVQTFDSKYRQHQPGRGYHGSVSARNLYVIKNSFPPAVFIELGNINHTRDQQRFIIEDNRKAVANWLYEGLVKDFGNNK
ncbi:MAG TPA: N-acetylmuramoyl-L-alanine amidase [Prolixibacteraceae bacterium]|nr:N-acetylmuramoyl-L-alanine amidase [Prolixibacteraceae bacterium]HCR90368.1 N-acetylmuramoyl-L-alanine amidase [Prolixibacteraceae bacterium]HCU61193.1 N-acetylmuramoyl-L-alanine amidase [Prolixibacteraceae bacterium]